MLRVFVNSFDRFKGQILSWVEGDPTGDLGRETNFNYDLGPENMKNPWLLGNGF